MTGLTIGSLFSGIGGLELGLERGIGNGAHTVFQVEQNAYCRAVLARHWPDALRYEDVRAVGAANLPPVDVLCGGFPCQDISYAGRGLGLGGERSGLWFEYARILREMGPRYIVVENVAALLTRGLDQVLGTLADIGYDAEWSVLAARDVGAPHRRDRLFLLAYPNGARLAQRVMHSRNLRQAGGAQPGQVVAMGGSCPMGDTPGARLPNWAGGAMGQPSAITEFERPGGREVERDFRGVAHGVHRRVDRLRALGNAVVPQVAEVVGRLIAQRELARLEAA